jgi:glycosyltransferase involved in cell wall biosynthesis
LANKSIPLVIVGEPNWKTDNLDRTISDLGIKKRIYFTGYVEEENLPLIFSLAKIFCFPSFAEGFGLPAIEAMASGVPVVVSNIPVMQEICGDAGNYINPYDPSDIACTIDSLLQDSEKYEIKKERGMKYAKKFSWNRSAQMLLNSIGKMKNHNEAC